VVKACQVRQAQLILGKRIASRGLLPKRRQLVRSAVSFCGADDFVADFEAPHAEPMMSAVGKQTVARIIRTCERGSEKRRREPNAGRGTAEPPV